MNFITRKTSWSAIELGIIKICLLCVGILVGVYLKDVLEGRLLPVVLVAVVTGIMSVRLWLKKLNG